jgi:hypothetical protein
MRVWTMWTLVVAVVAACGGARAPVLTSTEEPPASPALDREPSEEPPAPPAEPPAPPVVEPELPPLPVDDGRWVVLEQYNRGADTATHAAVRLAEDPRRTPKFIDLGESPAMSTSGLSRPSIAVAAHEGARWVQLETTPSGGVRAVVRTLPDSKPLVAVELGDIRPAALHLAGHSLWIGTQARVGWADLSAKQPRFEELVVRTERPGKSYDVFARHGDRLVAIDDVISPIYADWFSLDPYGRPHQRLADWELPAMVYGHYTAATLVPRGDEYELLALSTSSSGYVGRGHALYRLAIRGNVLFQGGPAPNVRAPRIHEVQGKGPYPAVLIAGTTYTEWGGFAITPDGQRVLVAAGKRGLISLPRDFDETTPVELVDVGGACDDVIVRGNTILALVTVREVRPELVVLETDGAKLRVTARHPLPCWFDRFVR